MVVTSGPAAGGGAAGAGGTGLAPPPQKVVVVGMQQPTSSVGQVSQVCMNRNMMYTNWYIQVTLPNSDSSGATTPSYNLND